MTSKKILVLEDNPGDRISYEMFFAEVEEYQVTYVSNSADFIKKTTVNRYDLFIMDIHINEELSGLDLAKCINNPSAIVIFISSMPVSTIRDTFEEIELTKFFLQKPIEALSLQSILNNLEAQTITPKSFDDKVFVKNGDYLLPLQVNEIQYLVSDKAVVFLHTTTAAYCSYLPLKHFEESLPIEHFIKINRGTLVNKEHIAKINMKDNSIIIDQKALSISRSQRKNILDLLSHKIV